MEAPSLHSNAKTFAEKNRKFEYFGNIFMIMGLWEVEVKAAEKLMQVIKNLLKAFMKIEL